MLERPKPGIGAYFRLFMASFIVVGAIGIFLGYVDHVDFIRQNKLMVGIPFLLYGLFRLYLAIRSLKGRDDVFNS